MDQYPALAKHFDEAGVKGTFVLYDVSANRFIAHNLSRAQMRFIPASTFKLPNSLIGLSVGAVKNVIEVLPYGDEPQPFDAGEKDMAIVSRQDGDALDYEATRCKEVKAWADAQF